MGKSVWYLYESRMKNVKYNVYNVNAIDYSGGNINIPKN